MKRDKQVKASTYFYQGLVIAILLVSTALRFTKLGAQSFWNDEGNTARLVERPVPLIIAGAAGDVHPPGYYLLLHVWRACSGESEFALRSYSTFCDITTVALTIAIAKHLIPGKKRMSRSVVLPALWFIAINPLAIYYSQEARMYAQLGLTSAGLLWSAVEFHKAQSQPLSKITKHQRITRFALLAGSVALGLYTHYAFLFALVSLGCAYSLFWLIYEYKNWRALVAWIGAFIVGGFCYLPWAPIALRASGWRPPDLGTATAFKEMARTLVVGVTLPEHEVTYILPILVFLGLLIFLNLPRAPFVTWVSFALAFFPMLLITGFGVYRPAYLKFLIISVSPLAVLLSSLMGGCLAGISNRWLPIALLLGVLHIFTPAEVSALQHLYQDPAYARDDYRGIVATIESEAQPGDAVLLNAPNQWEVFTYYDRGGLPVYTAPYRPTSQEASSWVESIVRDHTQLFVLFWGDTEADPEHYVEIALAQKAFKAAERWVSSVRLARYGTPAELASTVKLEDVRLGQMISLIGYSIAEGPLTAGEILPVTLVWSVRQTPSERYKVFIHLVDGTGTLLAQTDAEPVGGFYLTSQWSPGEVVSDNYGVLLPAQLESGTYTLIVGMYDLAGQRLPVMQDGNIKGDYFDLGMVNVQSPQ
jgi:mannosyltransferase